MPKKTPMNSISNEGSVDVKVLVAKGWQEDKSSWRPCGNFMVKQDHPYVYDEYARRRGVG